MNNRQKGFSGWQVNEQKKDVVFHKRPQFSLRRADLSSQVPPGFNVKGVSIHRPSDEFLQLASNSLQD